MTYRIEPLAADHDLDGFRCGNAELETWLRQHARRAAGQGTRTYVLVEDPDGSVVGFFVIAPHLVAREELPRGMGRGAAHRVPAVLLAKLALDQRLLGKGLGSELLVSALTAIVIAARAAGGRLIVLDAIDDDAASFYAAHDFQPSPTEPRRLLMKISTAARALDQPWH